MSSEPSQPFIVAFYDPQTRAQDGEGRTLDEICSFTYAQLERYHDYIQYLFPLPERSPVNPYAPTITSDVRTAFLERDDLRKELHRSLGVMLSFYGFAFDNDHAIVPSRDFAQRSKATWRTRMDHNHLRITRIIRCLRVLGLEAEARKFHQALVDNDKSNSVSQRSLMYWRRAAERALYLAPQDDDGADGDVRWLKEISTGERPA